jgi:TPR repeat protein
VSHDVNHLDRLFEIASAFWDRRRFRSAFEVFSVAAREGHVASQLNLGFMFERGQGTRASRKLASVWYRRASRQGDASAMSNLGILAREERRFRTARRWFRKALAAGDADALLELARTAVAENRWAVAERWLLLLSARTDATEGSRELGAKLLKRVRRLLPRRQR